MSLRNTELGWGWLARFLHWTMAVLILGLIAVGLYMVEALGDDSNSLMERYSLTQTHKSWGFVVFILALIRIGWRWVNPTPRLDGQGRLATALAHGGHLAIYICVLAIPITGWLMASASPYNDPGAYFRIPNMVFGLFELPDPYPKGDEALTERLARAHFYIAMALLVLVAGHAAMALKHHFVDKDNILRRMIRG